MGKVYIGIDNGVTGSIAVIGSGTATRSMQTPTIKEQDYQSSKVSHRTRIDHPKLCEFFRKISMETVQRGHTLMAVCERPMINPKRFDATISASRAQESLLIALERYAVPYEWIDSKGWQKLMLPKGAEGVELKKASCDIGRRLFPQFSDLITKQTDADSLLMAMWALRTNR